MTFMANQLSESVYRKIVIFIVVAISIFGGQISNSQAATGVVYSSADLEVLVKKVAELKSLLVQKQAFPKILGAGINMNATTMDTSSSTIDTDSDGLVDTDDNCPLISNTNQTDTDADGQGDVCDLTPRGQVVIVSGPSGDIPNLKTNPKVLFVGNSYTYAAPGGVRAESPHGMFMRMLKIKATGATHSLSVIGNSTMSELWNWTGKPVRTDPKTLLKTGTYDLLVLQSGDGFLSKTVPGSYEIHADLFANLAKENGTDVMLYGVWPFDNMISISKGETVASAADVLYKQTAARNYAGYAAAGMAYTQAHKKFTELYGNGDDGQIAETMLTYDSVHAAPLTAYLAANMMYLAAFGVHPPTSAEFLPAGVTQVNADILQTIAVTAHNTHNTVTNEVWYK